MNRHPQQQNNQAKGRASSSYQRRFGGPNAGASGSRNGGGGGGGTSTGTSVTANNRQHGMGGGGGGGSGDDGGNAPTKATTTTVVTTTTTAAVPVVDPNSVQAQFTNLQTSKTKLEAITKSAEISHRREKQRLSELLQHKSVLSNETRVAHDKLGRVRKQRQMLEQQRTQLQSNIKNDRMTLERVTSELRGMMEEETSRKVGYIRDMDKANIEMMNDLERYEELILISKAVNPSDLDNLLSSLCFGNDDDDVAGGGEMRKHVEGLRASYEELQREVNREKELQEELKSMRTEALRRGHTNVQLDALEVDWEEHENLVVAADDAPPQEEEQGTSTSPHLMQHRHPTTTTMTMAMTGHHPSQQHHQQPMNMDLFYGATTLTTTTTDDTSDKDHVVTVGMTAEEGGGGGIYQQDFPMTTMEEEEGDHNHPSSSGNSTTFDEHHQHDTTTTTMMDMVTTDAITTTDERNSNEPYDHDSRDDDHFVGMAAGVDQASSTTTLVSA